MESTEQDFVEQPKLTHHKKKMSEKDRERERLEVQQARKAAEFYRKRQEELNRPLNPREPLKRTADNNWVHVSCAVWTPEVKFGNAKALEPSEGIPSIPRSRYEEICQACNQTGGACIACHQCRIPCKASPGPNHRIAPLTDEPKITSSVHGSTGICLASMSRRSRALGVISSTLWL